MTTLLVYAHLSAPLGLLDFVPGLRIHVEAVRRHPGTVERKSKHHNNGQNQTEQNSLHMVGSGRALFTGTPCPYRTPCSSSHATR